MRNTNRKSTVKSAIQHTRSTPLKGAASRPSRNRTPSSNHGRTRSAATLIHGSARRHVGAMFQEERAHLKPLPLPLRTHPRAQRPGSLRLPDDERPFNSSRETRRILTQAAEMGPATLRLCRQWLERDGRVGQRKL